MFIIIEINQLFAIYNESSLIHKIIFTGMPAFPRASGRNGACKRQLADRRGNVHRVGRALIASSTAFRLMRRILAESCLILVVNFIY